MCVPADVSTHHVTRAKVFPEGVCSCAVSRGNLVTFPVSFIVMTSSLLASLMNMRTATGEQPTQQQQHVVVKIDSEKNMSKFKSKMYDWKQKKLISLFVLTTCNQFQNQNGSQVIPKMYLKFCAAPGNPLVTSIVNHIFP